jgi:cytochrome c-type biogenesis protein CcmH
MAPGTGGDGPSAEKIASIEAMPEGDRDAAIRSMVNGLAARLERSPRDLEGWTRLMRSRVVLGEREVAATALRQALEVFKDDAAASGKISAAAIELGLTAE